MLAVNMHNKNQSYFIAKLVEIFEQRKSRNSQYSLRSYAQSLDMNPGTLSSVLKGKRPLPISYVDSLVRKLKLSDEERVQFLASVSRQFLSEKSSHEIDPEKSKIIYEDREYFMILGAFRLAGFESSAEWIAKTVGLPVWRAKECIETLFALNLLEQDEQGQWGRVSSSFRSTYDVPSEAIRASHKNTLNMAIEKIESVPAEQRDYSFLTVALDDEQFRRLKKLNLRYRDRVLQLDERSQKTSLYRVAVQVFPLSDIQLKPEGMKA